MSYTTRWAAVSREDARSEWQRTVYRLKSLVRICLSLVGMSVRKDYVHANKLAKTALFERFVLQHGF